MSICRGHKNRRVVSWDGFTAYIKERRMTGKRLTLDYDFNLKRCKFVTKCRKVKPKSNGIIYYMHRDFRIHDNWALIFAQMLALKTNTFVYIVVPVKQENMFPTSRQFNFLMKGLREVAEDAKEHGMRFYILQDEPEKLTSLIIENNIGALVTDYSPLREHRSCAKILTPQFPSNVPIIQVDAHNVVPIWIASDREESSAKTFRPKVTKMFHEYLNHFPYPATFINPPKLVDGDIEMREGVPSFLELQYEQQVQTAQELPEIVWTKPGPTGAFKMLHKFMDIHMENYVDSYNNPSSDCISRLSPYLHFGFISSQRIALLLHCFKPWYPDQIEKFLDNLIVRKELADNYCYYNNRYDSLLGIRARLSESLREHCADERRCIYSYEQFELAKTHDPLWNAAQIQLIREGRIHSYMRMYWGKKILEWTANPTDAYNIAIRLNNIYSLDGNDPLGFAGVLWCIGGLHDQGYGERIVYGKVRYMVGSSLIHRFKMEPYLRKYDCWKEGLIVDGVYTPDAESLPRVIRKKKPKTTGHKRRRLAKKVKTE